jgi:two-component system, OmpR family, sensor histidine kinase KdpD
MAITTADLGSSSERPSPETLLREAQQSGRGRLKIFLGAAPGVGKTFEMLSTAQAKRREGVDVVVGIVETHGRQETQALLEGLEIIPRRWIEYRGRKLEEMDLDAVLARRPQLVLVDELAHTNAPGSRHPKRYQDVEELIAAGIDVYSTLNIQHIESLNDVVAKITRIRVRETVPDPIIDRADEVEIIDLTPEDLTQRLKEGKVYVPQQAERAIRHYFSQGNLTALRELALRRTAQRVDAQMVDYMQSRAILGPWPAGDRVLACVSGSMDGLAVVRHARGLAGRLKVPWTAIHVETSLGLRMSEAARDRAAEALRLAERLGAETVSLPGEDVAGTVADYAREKNFTHILIARSPKAWWRRRLFGSITENLIGRAQGADIHIITGQPQAAKPQEPSAEGQLAPRKGTDAEDYLGSLACVAAALGIGELLQNVVGPSSIGLIFLTAVLTSGILFGLWPSLLACLASALAYNFFFLPPLYTLTIADPNNVVALFFFVIVALIASNLAARVRSQAIVAQRRARTAEDLYLFSRKLAVAANVDDLLWITVHQIAVMLKVKVVILLPKGGTLTVRAGFPPEDTLDAADIAAAKWCWEKNRAAGRGADTLPGAKRLFLPMQTGRGPVGVTGIDRDKPGPFLAPEQQRLLSALNDQAALAIERVNLVDDVERARLVAETDRLRQSLLTSISHDLRTPLASILGSASTLSMQADSLPDAARSSLIRTIQEEAERLNRFIGNLLDMTRLESGPLKPRTSLVDLSDVVGAALQRATKILVRHRVKVDFAADLPMLSLDMVLFDQVLFNLLDNAAKYAPAGSLIRLRAWRENGWVRLQILDEGEGIPEGDLEHIFDKFYRARGADRRRAGTGLGLAVCRGFVEAMHGTISVANRNYRSGAVFTITLPVPTAETQSADTPS